MSILLENAQKKEEETAALITGSVQYAGRISVAGYDGGPEGTFF